MSIIPNQRFRFLGGEVSPNLYNSADMDQYGKWFSKAENIRFDTLGAFRNRTGFENIAQTKVSNGTTVKLLSFSFSREENYLIEMGPDYFRFFQNGQPIHVGGVSTNPVYEVAHTMRITPNDIKYAQSGDVLYLVNGLDPVGMLTRNDTTGYNWTFSQFLFKSDCMPLEEENTDKTKTLSISNATASIYPAYYAQFPSTCEFFGMKNVTIDITDTNNEHHTYSTPANTFYSTLADVAAYFNTTTMSTTYGLTCSASEGNILTVAQTSSETITGAKITTATYFSNSSSYNINYTQGSSTVVPDETASDFSTSGSYLYKVIFTRYSDSLVYQPQIHYDYILNNETYTLANAASLFRVSMNNTYSALETAPHPTAGLSYLVKTGQWFMYTNAVFANLTTVTNVQMQETTAPANVPLIDVSSVGHNFFENKNVNDIFAINFDLDAESTSLNGSTQSAVNSTSSVIKTNGKYSFATSGSWAGEIVLEYSLDGLSDWKIARTLTSLNASAPHNDNVAGLISADSDVVYMRLRVTSALTYDTYPLNAYLFGEKFSVNCYYKIVKINSVVNAICYCIKNNFVIGTGQSITDLIAWREGSFSYSKGYPSIVGIYQNRLIFGKEYMLYASKTNDFSDFYEPTTLVADDPITMSLLSNKYNRVRNILTIRKFFAFTEEGEFGISSQGALTQTDKNLLPISYHGSASCEPILAGNLALFVDFSGRVVRLFQYTYETDSFEATDASVFLEQLLKGRSIITTDYLKNTKEALFLDNFGTIWVFKLMPEQEVYAWSHWKYADSGKITNMRVVPNGSEEELYIAVEDYDLEEKRIERLSSSFFADSSKTYTDNNNLRKWFTDYNVGTLLVVDAGGERYKVIVGDNGAIDVPVAVNSITCHYAYRSEATLLSPTVNLTEDARTTYNKARPFKVYFSYQDSYGFQVGVEEGEKMSIRFNNGDRPESSELTTGKREVAIPARYDGSSRVSFIQERPYNMSISNIMIDMDYGGK